VNTVLRVDLGTGQARVQELTDDERRREPGFGVFGVRLLLDETPAGLDAYHPDQPVVFGVGAVAGRRALALPKFSVVGKSPLSGGIAESRVEGPFGPALRDTGHDAIVLTGQASRPSYVLVSGGRAEVLDAEGLWGLDTAEVTDRLVARHGEQAHVAAIGPAGENLVRFASIVADYGYAAARLGLGAVLGAKNCKALVVVGTEEPGIADPAAVERITADYVARLAANPLTHSEHQPPGFGTWPAEGLEGYLGARNYSTAKVELDQFTADAYLERMGTSEGNCPGCPQDCMKSFTGNGSGLLHQEAVAAFAGALAITDLDAVLELNAWCHRQGADPVSLAGVLAFRCELAERGLLEGPAFGDTAGLRSLASDVIQRSGDGALLADGVARAASRLGVHTEPFALHSKGIEMCGFDPRGSHGLALAYAVHPLGPRYDGVEHDIDFDPVDGQPLFIANAARNGCPPDGLPMADLPEVKVELIADLMQLWSGYDAVGLCLFAAPPTRNLSEDSAAELISAVTGWDVKPAEVREWGRRRLSLMRQYNLREGLTSADDVLPDRFFTLPVDGGRLDGAVLDRTQFTAATSRLRELLGWAR
jgi:aldehyde:ferredoxin oxidoreductase